MSYRISQRAKINLLDLNIYSETFFSKLMSYLVGYNFINLNTLKQNVTAIDLIDVENKIVVQVSSTCAKTKIESSLSKETLKDYSSYTYKFIAICGDATKLRKETFNNPYNINFSPNVDILDIKSILNIILELPIGKQKVIYEFLKEELENDIDIAKVDTNLASIINILASENLNINTNVEINAFEIENKINFNNLIGVQPIIEDYKIYYKMLGEKYNEFDIMGKNRSLSVLNSVRKEYITAKTNNSDSDIVFFIVIDNIINKIKKSKNYLEIPYEELEMCVQIIVVDAFIRCKIFENPRGDNYVIT